MSIQNKGNRSVYNKRYQLAHKEEIRKRKHLHYLANREEILTKIRAYKKANREKQRMSYRRWARKYKTEVLTYYGGGELSCVGCGDSRIDCLTIDHMNNNGYEHRKRVSLWGDRIYRWLRENNYPDGYQTLCMNCQFIKRKTKQTPNLKGRWVLLSDDQSLPEVPDGIKREYHSAWERAFLSMYNANFKRVI